MYIHWLYLNASCFRTYEGDNEDEDGNDSDGAVNNAKKPTNETEATQPLIGKTHAELDGNHMDMLFCIHFYTSIYSVFYADVCMYI